MSRFNPAMAQTIDQDTIESEGSLYPAISFHNGDPAKKKVGGLEYEGGWFISEDGAPADMTEYGWQKDSFVNRNGEEIAGYWAAEITVSVIRQRRRWVVNGQPYPWNKYEDAGKAGAPRGHQQYLVLLKGAEDLGPFVIGLKGHAGMCFSGSRQYSSNGALSCFNRTVIAAANAKTKPAKWPFRAFWLTVGGQKDKGSPVFTDVGKQGASSKVVLPVPVGLPEKAAEVDLDQFYVGDDVLTQVNQIFTDVEGWAAAWDSFTGATNGNGKPAAEDEEVSEEDLAEAGL